MDIKNIEINTQSSIKLVFDKTIYFDPYKIEENKHDADIIFITHNHYDHMDSESIVLYIKFGQKYKQIKKFYWLYQ